MFLEFRNSLIFIFIFEILKTYLGLNLINLIWSINIS